MVEDYYYDVENVPDGIVLTDAFNAQVGDYVSDREGNVLKVRSIYHWKDDSGGICLNGHKGYRLMLDGKRKKVYRVSRAAWSTFEKASKKRAIASFMLKTYLVTGNGQECWRRAYRAFPGCKKEIDKTNRLMWCNAGKEYLMAVEKTLAQQLGYTVKDVKKLLDEALLIARENKDAKALLSAASQIARYVGLTGGQTRGELPYLDPLQDANITLHVDYEDMTAQIEDVSGKTTD